MRVNLGDASALRQSGAADPASMPYDTAGLHWGIMPRKITPWMALSLSLLALSAQADPGPCQAPIHVWELELSQVAADAGQPNLQAIVNALGTKAVLRGGYYDPARPDQPVRVELTSSSGAPLKVLVERVK